MPNAKNEKRTLLGASFSEFMDQFVGESDRAAVILGAAKIDLLLLHLLDKYLLPSPASTDDLLEGDAPIGTFSARIKLCHRLGLIDNQFAKLLNTFRKLRNGFAHEVAHSSLSGGPARDRVAAMAEPFVGSAFFDSLVVKVAAACKREDHEPGVVFRATLALFHIHLLRTHQELQPVSEVGASGIVETCRESEAPSYSRPQRSSSGEE